MMAGMTESPDTARALAFVRAANSTSYSPASTTNITVAGHARNGRTCARNARRCSESLLTRGENERHDELEAPD